MYTRVRVWARARKKVEEHACICTSYTLLLLVRDSISNDLRCYHRTIITNCVQCLYLSLEFLNRKKKEKGDLFNRKGCKNLLFSLSFTCIP